MSGWRSRASAPILPGASPTIWRAWTRANASMSSAPRSSRRLLRVNRIAAFSASTMWHRRTPSSGFILDLRRLHALVAEVAAQVFRRAQVHLPRAQQRRELQLDLGHGEQARLGVRLEPDQQVDVAVRPRAAVQHRAEQGQPADAVAPAERRERIRI